MEIWIYFDYGIIIKMTYNSCRLRSPTVTSIQTSSVVYKYKMNFPHFHSLISSHHLLSPLLIGLYDLEALFSLHMWKEHCFWRLEFSVIRATLTWVHWLQRWLSVWLQKLSKHCLGWPSCFGLTLTLLGCCVDYLWLSCKGEVLLLIWPMLTFWLGLKLIAFGCCFWQGCFNCVLGKWIWFFYSLSLLNYWIIIRRLDQRVFPTLWVSLASTKFGVLFSWLIFFIFFYVLSAFNVNVING